MCGRYWSKGCALLSCLLGLTWIVGVFVVNQDTIFMAYLFNIFNTLQVSKKSVYTTAVIATRSQKDDTRSM